MKNVMKSEITYLFWLSYVASLNYLEETAILFQIFIFPLILSPNMTLYG